MLCELFAHYSGESCSSQGDVKRTHVPLEVCRRRVTRVDAPGHRQLLASNAYLNSSSQTTCSETQRYARWSPGWRYARWSPGWQSRTMVTGVAVTRVAVTNDGHQGGGTHNGHQGGRHERWSPGWQYTRWSIGWQYTRWSPGWRYARWSPEWRSTARFLLAGSGPGSYVE